MGEADDGERDRGTLCFIKEVVEQGLFMVEGKEVKVVQLNDDRGGVVGEGESIEHVGERIGVRAEFCLIREHIIEDGQLTRHREKRGPLIRLNQPVEANEVVSGLTWWPRELMQDALEELHCHG